MNPVHPLHHEVLQRDDKPYLMLLHGLMSSRAQWLGNIEALKAVCNPVVVELLGHGRSGAPAEAASYTAQAYVAYFEAIREALGVTDWFVCGQSFSAGLTFRYSLTHPGRVKGQIFTNSLSGLAPADTPQRQAERTANAAVLRQQGREALPNQRFFPRQGRLPETVFQAMLADAYQIDPNGLALGMEVTVPGLSMRETFHQTEVPTLLVNGTWEKAFQPMAQMAGELLPAMARVDLDGGHSINAENAAGFNRAVCEFVRAQA